MYCGRSGTLLISYRPFPNAAVVGYFEGKKLIFEWNGDVYEWISLENSFLPDGRWAAYVWLANTIPFKESGGSIVAPPNRLQEAIDQLLSNMKKVAQE